MLTKTFTYEDYNGVERTETHYFNLTKSELMEMELSTTGGYVDMINRIKDAQDGPAIMGEFKKLILKAYGIKSPDGKRIIKGKQISEEFEQTPVYDMLFMELLTDAEKAAAFINGIVPKELVAKANEQQMTLPNQ